jgi:hypothetical protein
MHYYYHHEESTQYSRSKKLKQRKIKTLNIWIKTGYPGVKAATRPPPGASGRASWYVISVNEPHPNSKEHRSNSNAGNVATIEAPSQFKGS